MATEQRWMARLPSDSKLATLRRRRHENGRDLKVVITQRDSETGGGKTTLAVWLALQWDIHGWDGEAKGTVEAGEFLDIYPDLDAHSVLIMDEAEELDARRSMQSENIEFSKHWMTMRTRQIDSILTLPTAGALDKRLLELADIRINVTARGQANVYRVKVDDHDREATEWFLEEISWPDVSDHPEYRSLDEQKQNMIDSVGDETSDDEEQSSADLKRAIRQEAKRRRRRGESYKQIAKNIPDNPDTGAQYGKATVYRWCEDVEVEE
jgi:hypothetical protein